MFFNHSSIGKVHNGLGGVYSRKQEQEVELPYFQAHTRNRESEVKRRKTINSGILPSVIYYLNQVAPFPLLMSSTGD